MRSILGLTCFIVVLLILIAGCCQTTTNSTTSTPTIPVGTSDTNAAPPSLTATLPPVGTSMAPGPSPTITATLTPTPTTSTIAEPSNSTKTPTSSQALISFVEVPPRGSEAMVRGMTKVDNPDRYRVIVYIKVDGAWWGPKPYWDQPLTTIAPNGGWSTEIVTGGNDKQATEVTAYLVPASFSPPTMEGNAALPAVLDQFPQVNSKR